MEEIEAAIAAMLTRGASAEALRVAIARLDAAGQQAADHYRGAGSASGDRQAQGQRRDRPLSQEDR